MSRNISFIIAVLVGMILLAQAKMNFKSEWNRMESEMDSKADTVQLEADGSLDGDSTGKSGVYRED